MGGELFGVRLLPALVLGCACIAAVLLIGDGRGGVEQPEGFLQPRIAALQNPGECTEVSLLSGDGAGVEPALTLFTNALVLLRACHSDVVFRLSGTQVGGVGPAVALSFFGVDGSALGRQPWDGYVAPGDAFEFLLESGAAALLSYSNDLKVGSEDRNLFVEWRAR